MNKMYFDYARFISKPSERKDRMIRRVEVNLEDLNMDPKVVTKIIEKLEKKVDVEELVRRTARTLRALFTLKEIETICDFFLTPLGRRVYEFPDTPTFRRMHLDLETYVDDLVKESHEELKQEDLELEAECRRSTSM